MSQKKKELMKNGGFRETDHIILSDQGKPIGKRWIDSLGNSYLFNKDSGIISAERLYRELLGDNKYGEKKIA